MPEDAGARGVAAARAHRVRVRGGDLVLPTVRTPSGFLAMAIDVEQRLGPDRGRRLDPLSQLALLAVDEARRDAGLGEPRERIVVAAEGIVVGSALGATTTSVRYARRLVRAGAAATNPIDFPDSIDGAPAAHVALDRRLGGPSLTFADGASSAAAALAHAARLIAGGQAERMYVVVGDKIEPWLADAIARDPDYARDAAGNAAIPAECIMALVLERFDAPAHGGEFAIEVVGFQPDGPGADSDAGWSAPLEWRYVDERLRPSIATHEGRAVVDPSGVLGLAGAWVQLASSSASRISTAGALEPAADAPIAERVRCGMPTYPRLGLVRSRMP